MAGSLPYSESPAPSHLSQQSVMDRQRPEYGYPSPTQMAVASSYSYPPQQQQSPHLPPLNLPPIRLDSQPQPSQSQPGQPPMASPLPPPQHGMPQYYHPGHPPPGQAMNMGSQLAMGAVRYQLPPQAGDHQRVLSGGRHKKEIKRRTKTGCLTCRKRRIKVRVRAFWRQWQLWHASCRRDGVANSGARAEPP
jgi:hypothetical protein